MAKPKSNLPGWIRALCLIAQALWAFGVSSPSLQAQTGDHRTLLYAVTFWDQKLITIDLNTGAGMLLTNLPISPRDLAELRGALYLYAPAGQGVKLSQLDPQNGAILRDLIPTNKIAGGEGALTIRGDGVAFASTSSGSTGTLFQVQLDTTNAALITFEGGLNPSLDGLAIDAEGELYGLSQNRAGAYSLYLINQLTGQPALIGGLGISFPSSGGVVAGLAVAPDGQLYAAVGNTNESRLLRVDKTTGVATEIGPIGFAGVSGICFIAQPPGPLSGRISAENFRLSWPAALGGLVETAMQANGPWTNANASININGAEASALLPREGNQRFFRLTR